MRVTISDSGLCCTCVMSFPGVELSLKLGFLEMPSNSLHDAYNHLVYHEVDAACLAVVSK